MNEVIGSGLDPATTEAIISRQAFGNFPEHSVWKFRNRGPTALTFLAIAAIACGGAEFITPNPIDGQDQAVSSEISSTIPFEQTVKSLVETSIVHDGQGLLVIHSKTGSNQAAWETMGVPIPSIEALPAGYQIPAIPLALKGENPVDEMFSVIETENNIAGPIFIPQDTDLSQAQVMIAGQAVAFPAEAQPWGTAMGPAETAYNVYSVADIVNALKAAGKVLGRVSVVTALAEWTVMGGWHDAIDPMVKPIDIIIDGQRVTVWSEVSQVDYRLYGNEALQSVLENPLAVVYEQVNEDEFAGTSDLAQAEANFDNPQLTPAPERDQEEAEKSEKSPFDNPYVAESIEKEVLKIAKFRRTGREEDALRRAWYVEDQAAVVLLPDGTVLRGQNSSEWHTDIYDRYELTHGERLKFIISGDIFSVKGDCREFIKLDATEFVYTIYEPIPVSQELVNFLTEEGYTVLGPDFNLLQPGALD